MEFEKELRSWTTEPDNNLLIVDRLLNATHRLESKLSKKQRKEESAEARKVDRFKQHVVQEVAKSVQTIKTKVAGYTKGTNGFWQPPGRLILNTDIGYFFLFRVAK